ncbi:type I-E CRISPR-associated protein Cas6/Cse3/CasE [Hydrocarboniclastica marina]|uniref:Type I-E CRISPR-associated protein Cas6/Cse3/CasE n=1 Tax=Hydrocarboniclastica marina TaxID=2259620 RepID=A0A4P7XK70_9ALTE|nr:type I-E CRISPR-associated protein Cas6/Cse3/CasE [Hydrocarboniclastica marina]QCF27511.1 type I-E CRISPR-associated protein Cas6/Cse3/CasE [Hydrocarboniclastica marina]
MFLSRVRVATEGLDRSALLALLAGDAYSNHQLLWRLFTDRQERNFLFRQEIESEQLAPGPEARGLPVFYVLSDEPPVNVPGLLQAETKALSPNLKTGDRLAFRLRANPTVARKQQGRERSVRHDVLMDAKVQCQRAQITDPAEVQARTEHAASTWLLNRGATGGFELTAQPQVSGYRQHFIQRKNREIRFSSVDYEGVLTVTNPEQFLNVLAHGLGRSRGFGCGLMLVRRS